MKTYKIHFIRHGLTESNVLGKYIGHTDEPLSADGAAQIQQMCDDYIYPTVDAVFSSPLSRCVETAKMIYPNNIPIELDGLKECNFGEFENKTAEELENHPAFSKWLEGASNIKPPFGESNEEFAYRICSCFEKIVEGIMKTGTRSTAIITHGGVIMTLLSAYGIPEAPVHEWLTPSGCGFTVMITPSVWMRGQKFEIIQEIPLVPQDENEYNKNEDFFDAISFEI